MNCIAGASSSTAIVYSTVISTNCTSRPYEIPSSSVARCSLIELTVSGKVTLLPLKGTIVRAVEFWEHFPDVESIKSPAQFHQTELDKFAEQEAGWLDMNVAVEQWRERLCNMSEEGWVQNEEYGEAKKKLAGLKKEVRLQCDGDQEDLAALERGWPFQDREEID